jgi:hypothetical protein
MAGHILRFEANAFSETVYDMPRLAAIRGASLACLYSPELVACVLGRQPGITHQKIYSGASQGVWRLDGDAAAARAAALGVRAALSMDDPDTAAPHAHMSYSVVLVDIVREAAGDELKALAIAEALCATDAMQGDGFPMPVLSRSASNYDRFGDRSRPANVEVMWPGEEKVVKISAAHHARRRFGRKQRQTFYEDYSAGAVQPDRDFSDDFDTMVADPPRDVAKSAGSKTAVFIADGDGLTGMRNAAFEKGGLAGLGAFSDTLLALQKRLLASILDWLAQGAKARPDHFLTPEKDGSVYRFEVLVWGGDEVTIVMPSWLAVEFASKFRRWTRDWAISGKPVTFSAGLVIANHKTPIRQSKTVAETLVNLAKQAKKPGTLQIEIFESLSMPDSDFQGYRDRLYFPDGGANDEQRDRLNADLMMDEQS